jgi:hypothetical protein
MIILYVALLSACAEQGVLKKEDYMRMSDSDIRNVILQYVPLGSKEEDVVKIVKEKFDRDLLKGRIFIYQNEQIAVKHKNMDRYWSDGDEKYVNIIARNLNLQKGDYYIDYYLSRFGWARNCFLAGEMIHSRWFFNKDSVLKDVVIEHSWDGV